jgi:hypothetical protein
MSVNDDQFTEGSLFRSEDQERVVTNFPTCRAGMRNLSKGSLDSPTMVVLIEWDELDLAPNDFDPPEVLREEPDRAVPGIQPSATLRLEYIGFEKRPSQNVPQPRLEVIGSSCQGLLVTLHQRALPALVIQPAA